MHTTEKQVQAAVKRLLRMAGCAVYDLSQPRATMQTADLPDILVFHRLGALLFIEVKAMVWLLLILACSHDLAPTGPDHAGSPLAIPLTDVGAGLYLGQYQGGLYPGGVNDVPADHAARAQAAVAKIQPVDLAGVPKSSGKTVAVMVGMSTSTQTFCHADWKQHHLQCNAWTFIGQALADSTVDHTSLVLFNGAGGGQTSASWSAPEQPNYLRVDSMLTARGFSEEQVQVGMAYLVRHPNPNTEKQDSTLMGCVPGRETATYGGCNAYKLMQDLGNMARAMRVRWPNVQVVFLWPYVYGGYDTSGVVLEPYAYEGGFGVKWVIEAQIEQARTGTINPIAGDLSNTVAPVLLWMGYPWADGTTPRNDGLTWERSDYETDGRHPSKSGEQKAGAILLDFFKNSPYSVCWFRTGGVC